MSQSLRRSDHVHARKGEYESKAELIVVNGEIDKIVITNVKGRSPLKGKELKLLKIFLQHYSETIIDKWVDFFVYRKDIAFEKITQRL